jgi:hypothetical protein
MRTISESLLLDDEQVDFLGQLEVGTAIVKLQGRYFRPFLVKIPLFPVKKGEITDKDIKSENGSCSAENEVIRVVDEVNEVVREVRGLLNKQKNRVKMTDEKERFLKDIARFPVSGVTTRYTRIGLNRYQGNKIQKELLENGYITFRQVSTIKGQIKVLVLTDKGKDKIRDVKIEKIFNKNASWEHEYWKYRVGMLYRKKGYTVSFEYRIEDGKFVDAVAEKDGIRIAIEIETGKSDYVYNVKKDLDCDDGFNEILVLALDRMTRERIENNLEKSTVDRQEKVKIMDIGELFASSHV